ncbi:hypothetical protein M0R72_21555 [Candidatus Pacearchaeota archaeon]|jgi:hypothetical protein|nr:hypothetical protein [Candidatus Pacearchaeota archaeon]
MKAGDQLKDELYKAEMGTVASIEVISGGQVTGLDCGPILIEIVVLDGATVAYRESSDTYDGNWKIGRIEDAIEAAKNAKDDYEMAQEEVA